MLMLPSCLRRSHTDRMYLLGLARELVGVAQMIEQSGKSEGKRRAKGGRGSVRRVLYMSVLVATKNNSVINKFYIRLLSQGKPKKLALAACMRKLLTMLNAMVRQQKTRRINQIKDVRRHASKNPGGSGAEPLRSTAGIRKRSDFRIDSIALSLDGRSPPNETSIARASLLNTRDAMVATKGRAQDKRRTGSCGLANKVLP